MCRGDETLRPQAPRHDRRNARRDYESHGVVDLLMRQVTADQLAVRVEVGQVVPVVAIGRVCGAGPHQYEPAVDVTLEQSDHAQVDIGPHERVVALVIGEGQHLVSYRFASSYCPRILAS